MIEVAPGLYVGNQIDYEKRVKHEAGWSIVHACKEPYHREAVGYKGMGCPREHDEYLYAERGRSLCLNMVDAPKPEFFADKMIEAALSFISARLAIGEKILVHCNQGGSRAPSLALLWLRRHDPVLAGLSFEDAETAFRHIYPPYQPAAGIRGYVERNWSRPADGEAEQSGQGSRA